MDWGAWWAAVHGVVKSRTRLSDFTSTFHFHALEKEMATHQCSCLENPRDGGAWWAAVMGSHRVGHDWSNLTAVVAAAESPQHFKKQQQQRTCSWASLSGICPIGNSNICDPCIRLGENTAICTDFCYWILLHVGNNYFNPCSHTDSGFCFL